MDIQRQKERLLKLETEISARVERHVQLGREQTRDDSSVRDIGDSSVADEAASEEFTQAELDSTVLQQVRDALQRIENGEYGKCLVDGQPIDEKRLEALPWTPYCLKHQQESESTARRQFPTL
jgi:DnaK suppressor protein